MARHGDQIAALPMFWDKKGGLQVLMVTSRDTGRWVMPKGWETQGLSAGQQAGFRLFNMISQSR